MPGSACSSACSSSSSPPGRPGSASSWEALRSAPPEGALFGFFAQGDERTA